MMGYMDDKFEEVYRTHFRDIYRYAYRVVENKVVAEDIAQDVFCAALHLGNEFLNHPNREGWLMVAAKNKLSEMRRKMGCYILLPLDEELELETGESDFRAVDLELTALSVLGREEWRLVKEYYLGETTIRELAEEYGITENNMRVRLHRLKEKVRRTIQ